MTKTEPKCISVQDSAKLDSRTIADFGEQWTRFPETDGFFGSRDLLADFLGPEMPLERVAGKRVAEIGAGSGRWVLALLEAGAEHVTAVEPSEAFHVLRRNTVPWQNRVTLLNARGDLLPPDAALDLVISIGVLHHVVNPEPIMRAALAALRPGGEAVIWLYGREDNGLYLTLLKPLRWLSARLGSAAVLRLSSALNSILSGYMALCRRLPYLPLARYLLAVIQPLPARRRRLVIYDQLKPAYAKYYRRSEAEALLKQVGFINLRLHHRHGTGWTVCGQKPPTGQNLA